MTLNDVTKNKRGFRSHNKNITRIEPLRSFALKMNLLMSIFHRIKFKRRKFCIDYTFPKEECYLIYTLFGISIKPPHCLGDIEKEKNISERSKHE